jgi:tripartite ATP-independent transporter DctM subunit
MIAVTIVAFFVFTLLGVPIAFSLGLAAAAGMLYADWDLVQLAGKMLSSVDSFPLMAIPLFVLAGELMIRGNVMEPLIALANAIVGRIRGGLALVTVQATMILSSLSGVAVADATAIGGTLGKSLEKAYGKPFSASLVATASCMGPIIPPSAPMILYAIMVSNTSVAGLFLGGVVPGILIGGLLMLYSLWVARRRGYPATGEAFSVGAFLRALRRALVFLGMPVVVIGGIMIGAFTATEGAAIAALYALVLGLFVTRALGWRGIAESLVHAGSVTAIVGALIAFSSTVTHIFTVERVGETVAGAITSLGGGPLGFMVMLCVVLLVLGMFIEGNSLIIMTAPILAPVGIALGVDPIHLGVLFVFCVVMGTLTPPVGVLLFVVSSIWQVEMRPLVREVLPMLGLLTLVLAACLVFPELVTALPRAVLAKP